MKRIVPLSLALFSAFIAVGIWIGSSAVFRRWYLVDVANYYSRFKKATIALDGSWRVIDAIRQLDLGRRDSTSNSRNDSIPCDLGDV